MLAGPLLRDAAFLTAFHRRPRRRVFHRRALPQPALWQSQDTLRSTRRTATGDLGVQRTNIAEGPSVAARTGLVPASFLTSTCVSDAVGSLVRKPGASLFSPYAPKRTRLGHFSMAPLVIRRQRSLYGTRMPRGAPSPHQGRRSRAAAATTTSRSTLSSGPASTHSTSVPLKQAPHQHLQKVIRKAGTAQNVARVPVARACV